ncbi:MAG: hypothetical protein AAB588_05770 [Patescibacteria group bacterium]
MLHTILIVSGPELANARQVITNGHMNLQEVLADLNYAKASIEQTIKNVPGQSQPQKIDMDAILGAMNKEKGT